MAEECTEERCRLTGTHRAHWDGKEFWPNAGFTPPPSRQRPGRGRADRISRQAHDLMTGVRDRTRERTGEQLRDEGQAAALAGSPEEWRAAARAEMERLARTREPFTSEDLVARVGLPTGGVETNANNAVGAIFAAASRKGLIERTGRTVKAQRAASHAAALSEWVGRHGS